MSEPSQVFTHELVSVYPLEGEDREELLTSQKECTFNWATQDGWPVGVIMSYMWRDGRFWLTCAGHRHRVAAIRRDPRVSIVISDRRPEGGARTVTAKGRAIIHEDKETKDWFFQNFHVSYAGFDAPLRIVISVEPEKWITFDGAKVRAHERGELPAEKLGPRLSSDAKRMPQYAAAKGVPLNEAGVPVETRPREQRAAGLAGERRDGK